ncbi:methylenetetrahydrofolate reductase [NAD(P)H] [Planctomycetales bacterium ZRK34]|nr:methylenetetrahydrofolate reductase [NAD(P)H] [Planctomycetales bacterium ZRK34]
MTIRFPQIYQQKAPTFSFEFFPPKTDAAQQRLRDNVTELKALGPTYVTCTYGAGGSTRQQTGQIVAELARELQVPAAAHLTCVGNSREQLIEVLEGFAAQGIANIVALRGDAPAADASSGGVATFEPHPEGLRYANELVTLIRERFGDTFGIAVAGYPEGHIETPSRLTDLDNLKRKVDAGADMVMTQLFFDNRDFYDFVERCELAGITVPIVAGIMPIVTRAGIMKMAGLCGARLPSKLLKKLQAAGDDDEKVARVGIDWATRQCHDLLEHHVRGIHFYTLNRSNATIEIYRRLGATDSQTLADIAGDG